ncbi:MAG: hydroxymethylbilane synthase [Beijerinckiaceae bacterium]|nr:hydroxymethylbilane synthase [Beijerinckiaceae bacterium]MCI0735380.1 hydroxymethylbilane synthase [Beijerinckiaceae bacterium]
MSALFPGFRFPAHRFRIGTRGSPLALAQANELIRRLELAHGLAGSNIEIVAIKTSGDTILNLPLSEAGGKGLFTKELDLALLAGEIDAAVHSAKDLPTTLPPGIEIAGYLPREDVRDAWISPNAPHPLKLAPGSVVGTASPRRGAMVRRLRPDLQIALLRGNVETRLGKVAKGEVAATLLALAGLKRLGMEDKATAVLDTQEFVPAAGQGAIAMTVRSGDSAAQAFLAPVLDRPTGMALTTERAFLRVLDGSCKTPIGAHARVEDANIVFHAIVLAPDGSRFFETEVSGPIGEAVRLGETTGQNLAAQIPAGFFAP